MRPSLPSPSTLVPAVSAGLVALGVAVNGGFEPSIRTIPALVVTVVGLAGVASSVADRPLESLRLAARRWWILAFATFLPYGLATAPSSEKAKAVGDAFSGPIAVTALEAAAGATLLCAVTVTTLYWFGSYGVHPGRQTPEERLLDD
ncbi:DUF1467 domain-containing protein [Natrialbaceae archaeon A-gly3]